MREPNCCGVITPERTKRPFVEILLELSTSSVLNYLVENAEDTPDRVCQGGMFSMGSCSQGLVSFAVRGT